MGTKVVTGSSACKGGEEARGGARGAATGAGGAGSRTGSTGSGWVETGQPGVVVSPIWTWNLWGRGGCYQWLAFSCSRLGLQPYLHRLQDIQRGEIQVQGPVQVGYGYWALQF